MKYNGENFNNKDALQYIMQRVDCIDKKLTEGAGKIAANRQAIEDGEKDRKSIKRLIYAIGGSSLTAFLFLLTLYLKGG